MLLKACLDDIINENGKHVENEQEYKIIKQQMIDKTNIISHRYSYELYLLKFFSKY